MNGCAEPLWSRAPCGEGGRLPAVETVTRLTIATAGSTSSPYGQVIAGFQVANPPSGLATHA
jgi:hypothetical protein